MLSGCANPDADRIMDRAEAIMYSAPDSAMQALDSLAATASSLPKSQRMRHALLTTEAKNRLLINLSSQTIMEEVADYYRHHGDRKEKVMAVYLLGSVYRDRGDVPYALDRYHEALELSDTTEANADYKMLAKIYGQMYILYDKVFLPELEIEAVKKCAEMCLKDKDTLSYIAMQGILAHPYAHMGYDTLALTTMENAVREYSKYNMEAHSLYEVLEASIYSRRISDYKKVGQYISQYEQLVRKYNYGAYPDPQRCDYYCVKADYYLHHGKLDSAKIFYDKAMTDITCDSIIRLRAYEGLMRMWREKNDAAMVNKYSQLYCALNDSSLIRNSRDIVNRMQAQYRYDRAEKAKMEAEMSEYRLMAILVILIILASFAGALTYLWLQRERERQRAEIVRQNAEYGMLRDMYEKATHEYQLLQTDFGALKREKEEEIEIMKAQMKAYMDDDINTDTHKRYVESAASDILSELRMMARVGDIPAYHQLKEMEEYVLKTQPDFYRFIAAPTYGLSPQERQTCLMTRLGFTTSEIAVLMNVSKQRATNIKSYACMKLYGQKSARLLAEKLSSV